ncbi:Predicted pyridoxal phosphate-dependent enzyme apparently involved in regulation of cell wall biogenesis [Clostridium putrefaciens]|uniref:Predicted pyridoxal phosphate-dependent enzyme apparently involved in regulation of cell wall biogenesis n=1 Tax=Clostridium putrefaciens TaxID=99675 RepID=A0A381J6S6_9CLOT|nr:hypothetical protein [Clostridium putrefaciens]SUY45804.1 Predicted pyridoxal phosphate-dependent enzyme apparently involved in regulation of cell wall biogenesis [Clostridium putrefaciens]
MLREIGSEFHIELEVSNELGRSFNIIQKKYEDYRYTRSGREAIGFILSEIVPCKKVALLPTYICKSMLQPFLNKGYSIEYFGIDENFNPILKDIEKGLCKDPDVMLVIDWFGMSKNHDAVCLAKEYSKRMIILSDCTHSYFNESMTFEPDFIVASLRKWFAIPDGAIAISCKYNFKNGLQFNDSLFYKNRKEAMKLKSDYIKNGEKDLKVRCRKLLSEAEVSIELDDKIFEISPFSLSIINQMDFDYMKRKRRENFNILYNLIDRSIAIPIVNKIMTEEECPFCFPIIVENNRTQMQEWLAKNGIYCPVLWPLPDEVCLNYEVSSHLSDNMLSIPCDQRYSVNDMEYIAKTIKAFSGGTI